MFTSLNLRHFFTCLSSMVFDIPNSNMVAALCSIFFCWLSPVIFLFRHIALLCIALILISYTTVSFLMGKMDYDCWNRFYLMIFFAKSYWMWDFKLIFILLIFIVIINVTHIQSTFWKNTPYAEPQLSEKWGQRVWCNNLVWTGRAGPKIELGAWWKEKEGKGNVKLSMETWEGETKASWMPWNSLYFQICIQYFLCISMLLELYCTYIMFESYNIIPFSFLDEKCEMVFFY